MLRPVLQYKGSLCWQIDLRYVYQTLPGGGQDTWETRMGKFLAEAWDEGRAEAIALFFVYWVIFVARPEFLNHLSGSLSADS